MTPEHSYVRNFVGLRPLRVSFVMLLAFLLVASSLLLQPLLSKQTPAAAVAGGSFQVKAVETAGPGKDPKTSGFTCTANAVVFTANTAITVNSGDVNQQAGVGNCSFGRAYVTDGTRKMEISSATLNANDEIVVTPVQGKYYAAQDDVEVSVPLTKSKDMIVFEYWSQGSGIPITYDYSSVPASANFSISGNDFKLNPDNVQFYTANGNLTSAPYEYYADVKIELARGLKVNFSTPDANTVVTPQLNLDLSQGDKQADGSVTNQRTVNVYRIYYKNTSSRPASGNIKITVSRITNVHYTIDTVNPDQRRYKSPGSLTWDEFGQSNRDMIGADWQGPQPYVNHYGYTYMSGAANISRMINPFVYKINLPSDTDNWDRTPYNRAHVFEGTGSEGYKSNPTDIVDGWAPERRAGSSPVNPNTPNSNVFDFFVQENGLPYQMLNGIGRTAPQDPPLVTWNYFLSRLAINGQWMPIPAPTLSKLSSGSGNAYYRQIRHYALGGLDATPWKNSQYNPSGEDSYSRCYINNGLTDVNGNVVGDSNGAHIYSPFGKRTPFFQYTFNTGPLTGTRVEVSLVNMRNHSDGRAFGRYRSNGGHWASNHEYYAKQEWRWQRDYQGNAITWVWDDWWRDENINNTFPEDSGPQPSWASGNQLDDFSSCTSVYGNFFSDRRNSFHQLNTWKGMWRIRVVNPTSDVLDVQARFDTNVNGLVWNAGSTGIYTDKIDEQSGAITGQVDTFGARIKSYDSENLDAIDARIGKTLTRPVCGADSKPAGCTTALKKWMVESKPVFYFKLKDGYTNPVVEVQTSNAAGAGEYALQQVTPVSNPNKTNAWWAQTADANGRFSFSFADNINPAFCEGNVCVGYSSPYGARVTASVANVPVNYQDANGELYTDGAVVNGQLVNRVFANKFTVGGPVPAKKNGQPASSWDLFKKVAGQSELVPVAQGILPATQVDIKTIGGNGGIQLVDPITGKQTVEELVLRPSESSTSTQTTNHLIYSVNRYAGNFSTLHDSLGDFIAVAGMNARVLNPAQSIVHNGATYFYNSDQSDSTKALTADTAASLVRLMYSQRDTTVRIDKKWVVNGTSYVNGAQPQQLQSKGQLDGTSINWGSRTAFNQSAAPLTLAETVSRDGLFQGCTPGDVTVDSNGSVITTISKSSLSVANNSWKVSATVPVPQEKEENVTQTNTVPVNFAYVSGTKEYQIPSEVNALRPASTTANYGEKVTVALQQTVSVAESGNTGYSWFFAGWDAQQKMADGPVTFVGKWLRLKTGAQKVSGYRWAWADTLTTDGVPSSELPELPAPRVVDAAYITPTYPSGVSKGRQIVTSVGTVTVDDVVRTGSIVTIKLLRPEKVNVKYDYKIYNPNGTVSTFDNTIKNGAIKTADSWLKLSLPDASTAAKGSSVEPAAMKNRVVNLYGTDYSGGGQAVSLLFMGWEQDKADANADVTFVAKFEFVLWSGFNTYTTKYRGVSFKNVSTTAQAGSAGGTLNIPAGAESAMNKKLEALVQGYSSPKYTQTSTGSINGTWSVPAFNATVQDKQLNGTWVFKGFKQKTLDGNTVARAAGDQITVRSGNATPSNDEFPRTATDDRNFTDTADRNLQMVAEWKFETTPVYTVTNNVTCHSNLFIQKTVGTVDSEITGAAGGAVRNDFTMTMDTSFNGNQLQDPSGWDTRPTLQFAGELNIPGPDTPSFQYNRANRVAWFDTNLGVNIGETDFGKKPAYAFQGWQCDSGDLYNQDQTTKKAVIRYGLGQQVNCSVTNTPAQLTLFTEQLQHSGGNSSWGMGTVALKAAPKVAVTGLPSLTANQSQASVASSTNNTVYTKPETTYTVTAPTTVGLYKLVRFERYIGDDKAGVKSDDTSSAWINLGSGTVTAASAAGAAGTTLAAGETNNVLEVTVPTGEREIIRAVYEENIYRPELPITGGWASDLFFLLGAAALTAGIAGAIAHNRRKGRTNPEVC